MSEKKVTAISVNVKEIKKPSKKVSLHNNNGD